MENTKAERILFVDDEENILEIAREYFELKGYKVLTARNGLEAADLLAHQPVDCCFTDINMPEMNGLELAEHIRTNDNTIPVVVMTGYPSLENTIHTLKNGVVDFLVKPVNLNQMELCVQRVMRERKLFVENLLLKKEVESTDRLKKLNQELRYKVTELNILNKIMRDFASISSSTNVFKRVVNLSAEIVAADQTKFYLINGDVQKPFEVAQFPCSDQPPLSPGDPQKGSIQDACREPSSEHRLIMEVAADNIPLLISENSGSQNLPEPLRSFMVVPLEIRKKVFGVLTAAVTSTSKRFNEKDLYYLSYITQNAATAIENLALYENIYENLFATLYAFVNALEVRDPYTQQHSSRVAAIAMKIGQELGCGSEEMEVLNFAGHLHDIGKIGIPDVILLKPGKLTAAEFEKIKEHPVIGANIVGRLGLWDRERQIIRCHHERIDGTGYPDGLQGEQIPFLARILSVADVYDALASDRAYRRRMSEENILHIIDQSTGCQFFPDVVAAFKKLHSAGRLYDGLRVPD